MKTADAYSVLVTELETFRSLSIQELIALASFPALERSLDIAGEFIELEVLITWFDSERTALLITGHARGPSTWRHEHLQESITVPISLGITNGVQYSFKRAASLSA